MRRKRITGGSSDPRCAGGASRRSQRRGEGYVGIYQFAAVTILPPFGIDRNAALAYIIVAQALGYAVVLVLGLLGLYRIRARQG